MNLHKEMKKTENGVSVNMFVSFLWLFKQYMWSLEHRDVKIYDNYRKRWGKNEIIIVRSLHYK